MLAHAWVPNTREAGAGRSSSRPAWAAQRPCLSAIHNKSGYILTPCFPVQSWAATAHMGKPDPIIQGTLPTHLCEFQDAADRTIYDNWKVTGIRSWPQRQCTVHPSHSAEHGPSKELSPLPPLLSCRTWLSALFDFLRSFTAYRNNKPGWKTFLIRRDKLLHKGVERKADCFHTRT